MVADTDNLLRVVELLDTTGQTAAFAKIPRFHPPYEVLCWGSRYFRRGLIDDTYEEIPVYFLIPQVVERVPRTATKKGVD